MPVKQILLYFKLQVPEGDSNIDVCFEDCEQDFHIPCTFSNGKLRLDVTPCQIRDLYRDAWITASIEGCSVIFEQKEDHFRSKSKENEVRKSRVRSGSWIGKDVCATETFGRNSSTINQGINNITKYSKRKHPKKTSERERERSFICCRIL